MKKYITFIVAFCLIAVGFHAQAQTYFGLVTGECYSPEQMEVATGMKAIEIKINGTDWKQGYEMRFREGLVLHAGYYGEFYGFVVTGRKFILFKENIDGGLRIGDDISRIFSLKDGYPHAEGDGTGKVGIYRIFTKQDDTYGVVFDRSSGKITEIHWCLAA